MKKDSLTSEEIASKFSDRFSLCNVAINVSRNMIKDHGPLPPLAEIIERVDDLAKMR